MKYITKTSTTSYIFKELLRLNLIKPDALLGLKGLVYFLALETETGAINLLCPKSPEILGEEDNGTEIDAGKMLIKIAKSRFDRLSPTHTRAGLGEYLLIDGSWYIYDKNNKTVTLSTDQTALFVPLEISNKAYQLITFKDVINLLADGIVCERYDEDDKAWYRISKSQAFESIQKYKFFRQAGTTIKVGETEIAKSIEKGEKIDQKSYVFVVSTVSPDYYSSVPAGSIVGQWGIEHGIAHRTPQAAKAHTKAIFELLKG